MIGWDILIYYDRAYLILSFTFQNSKIICFTLSAFLQQEHVVGEFFSFHKVMVCNTRVFYSKAFNGSLLFSWNVLRQGPIRVSGSFDLLIYWIRSKVLIICLTTDSVQCASLTINFFMSWYVKEWFMRALLDERESFSACSIRLLNLIV